MLASKLGTSEKCFPLSKVLYMIYRSQQLVLHLHYNTYSEEVCTVMTTCILWWIPEVMNLVYIHCSLKRVCNVEIKIKECTHQLLAYNYKGMASIQLNLLDCPVHLL